MLVVFCTLALAGYYVFGPWGFVAAAPLVPLLVIQQRRENRARGPMRLRV